MNKKILGIFFLLFILFCSLIIKFPGFAANTIDNDCIKVFKLQNGHTVVIKENHSNNIVTVDTWVKTGSLNEDCKNNGVSHFLEHLLFKGTKNHKAGESDKILESKGAKFNAATSKDFTHFYTTIDSQYVKTALDLQADMLLNATIPQDELDKERKVVQEEIRRAQDTPERTLSKNLNDILFKMHPYKFETLGTPDIIANIPRAEILNYYQKWYIPSNMITVIVGDVKTNEILPLVEQDFASCNKTISPKSIYAREPYIDKLTEKVAKGDYNTGYTEIAFKGVPITDQKDNYALDLAASILGQGTSSRLYQDIKEKQNLVSSISSGHSSMRDDSVFYVEAEFKPENYDKIKNAVFSELERLRNTEVSQEELQRAKTLAQKEFLYSNESVEDVANSIGYNMVLTGNIDYYKNYISEINKVTAKEVQNAAKKYLIDSRAAISTLVPANNEIKTAFKSQESFQNVSKTSLNNGITLITDKNNSNNIVSLSVFVKGGNLIEPVPGISSVIAKTLLKGTANRSALEISKELENSGIIISPSSNFDYFEIQLKSTISDFDKAFDLLADIVENPSFDNQYILKAKNDISQEIDSSRDNPSSYAFEKFNATMYPDHPYGYVGEIVKKNLPLITKDQIIKFYKENFIPENMIVSVSGNINQEDIARKFSCFSQKSTGKIINSKDLEVKFQPLAQNKLVSVKKDTSTAWILLGWRASSIINDKDYATLKVISSILGDGMSSRLFVDLREKQGLAYAVSSIYPSRLDNSFFVLYIGTEPKNTNIVVDDFLKEIDTIKTVSVNEKELSEAKQKLIGQFSLAQETNQDKAHYLGWFETLGKGYKYNYQYKDLVNSVTTEDIMQIANKYFNNPYLISIVAPKEYVDGLEKEYKK